MWINYMLTSSNICNYINTIFIANWISRFYQQRINTNSWNITRKIFNFDSVNNKNRCQVEYFLKRYIILLIYFFNTSTVCICDIYKVTRTSGFRMPATATIGSIDPEAGIVGTSNEITYLYLVLPSQISAEIFLWLNQRPFRSWMQACASAGSRNVTCATPSGCLWEEKSKWPTKNAENRYKLLDSIESHDNKSLVANWYINVENKIKCEK